MARVAESGLTACLRRLWSGFRKLNQGLARVTRDGVAVLATVMVMAIVWQVLTRLAWGGSPPWTEEVALLAFSWIVLLMTSVCVREHLHVRVDSLVTALPRPAARLLESLISLLIAAIGAYLLWSGIGYLQEMNDSRSQAIRYPSSLLNAAVPVASVLLILFALENAIQGLADGTDGAP